MSGFCVFCRTGVRQPGRTSITLTRGETALTVQHVPADVCDTCGHAYFSAAITSALEQRHEQALAVGMRVAIVDFTARVA